MSDKNKVREVILTVGIPASGKSTWADEQKGYGYAVIERDIIREELFDCTRSEYKYSKGKENQVTDKQEDDIKTFLDLNIPIIIADTNLQRSTRHRLYDMITDYCDSKGYTVEVSDKVFEIPLKDAMERNRKRQHTVPEHVMIRMEKRMREYLGKYTHDHTNPENLPECILVDIDGTVADMAGKRHPFEWEKVGGDLPKGHIINTVNLLADNWFRHNCQGKPEVIYMSGRDSVCRAETEEWLYQNLTSFICTTKLYMRPEGDNRPDTVIKEELFDKFIRKNYHVQMIFDDRKCMVQHWQSIGFNVLDVGNGISDF